MPEQSQTAVPSSLVAMVGAVPFSPLDRRGCTAAASEMPCSQRERSGTAQSGAALEWEAERAEQGGGELRCGVGVWFEWWA